MKPDVDQHLAEMANLQWVFKTDSIRTACIAICRAALAGSFWPDEVLVDLPPDDVNCIGNAYKLLTDHLDVIAKAQPFECRRSKSKSGNSRTIFLYKTVNLDRARQIAHLNTVGQLDLGLAA
ncbi:MAG: hypothetical protein PW734_06770 [Verrucomicrobium sp.]|nr:hypothetical protein [Verrucomicrobium sp.]